MMVGGWFFFVLLLVVVVTSMCCHGLASTSRAKRQQRGRVQTGTSPKNTGANIMEKVVVPVDTSSSPSTLSSSVSFVTTLVGQNNDNDDEDEEEKERLWKIAGQTSRRKKQRGRKSIQELREDSIVASLANPLPITTNPIERKQATFVRDATMEECEIVNIELIYPSSTRNNEAHDNSTTTPILADITFAHGTIVRGVDPTTLHQRQDHAVWMALRQAMNVTASELSAIVGNSVFTTRERLLQKKSGVSATSFTTTSPPVNRQALEWGLKMEPKALKQYCEATGNQVQETGLHIRQFLAQEESSSTGTSGGSTTLPSMVLVGASPDGLVTDAKDQTRGVLEIKSLWGRRHKKELPQFKHCPQRFWDQIQGQMAVCNVEWCDLIIYIPPNTPQTKQKQKRGGPGKNFCILRIPRDRSYWNETLFPAIQSFCKEVEELRATPRGITTDSPTVDDNMDSDMSIQD